VVVQEWSATVNSCATTVRKESKGGEYGGKCLTICEEPGFPVAGQGWLEFGRQADRPQYSSVSGLYES